jgi:hypothetical protein
MSMISEPTSIFHSQAVNPVESRSQTLEVLHDTLTSLVDVQNSAIRHVSFLSVCFILGWKTLRLGS